MPRLPKSKKPQTVPKLDRERYQLIYADPPWDYSVKNRTGCANNHYSQMTLEELKRLRVDKLADARNCALFLWTTFPKLNEAIELIKHWGFEYKTLWAIWVKVKKREFNDTENHQLIPVKGLGYYTRSNAEVCLLATRGRNMLRFKRDSQVALSSVVMEPRREHSRKPERVRELIDTFFDWQKYDLRKVELFARTTSKNSGWHCWGNEIGKFEEQTQTSQEVSHKHTHTRINSSND